MTIVYRSDFRDVGACVCVCLSVYTNASVHEETRGQPWALVLKNFDF